MPVDNNPRSVHEPVRSGDPHAGATGRTARERPRASEAGSPLIDQAMLERVVAIDAEMGGLQEERDGLRTLILAGLRKGVPVEPGRLEARFRDGVEYRPTYAELRRIFGVEFVDGLREQLRPANRTYLTIRESREGVDPETL
jgi:hypothetical protein